MTWRSRNTPHEGGGICHETSNQSRRTPARASTHRQPSSLYSHQRQRLSLAGTNLGTVCRVERQLRIDALPRDEILWAQAETPGSIEERRAGRIRGCGAIAQLRERSLRTGEVEGLNPPSSTKGCWSCRFESCFTQAMRLAQAGRLRAAGDHSMVGCQLNFLGL